jgi:pimeloyl-ACP methyl ester carboxylesterase
VATLFLEMPSLGTYALYSYASYYGPDAVPLDRVLLPRWLPTFERDVTSKCIDEIEDYYGYDPTGIYTPAFVEALRGGSVTESFPELARLFAQNKAGLSGQDIPVLVLHGTDDTVVLPRTLRRYMAELCASDGRGHYVVYPNVPHVMIRQSSLPDAVEWMQGVLAGKPAPNDCG